MNSNNITINLENVSEENIKKLKAVLEDIEQDNCKWVDEPELELCRDRYYTYEGIGIKSYAWMNDEIDYYNFDTNNIFQTAEEAEFALEKRKILAKLERYSKWCWEQFGMSEKEAWNSVDSKFSLIYQTMKKEIVIFNSTQHKRVDGIYFPTIENAKKAIEIIGEENLKKYAFGVEV